MRPFKKREKALLASTLLVVGSALLYSQVVDPRVHRALDLHAQIVAAEKDEAETRGLIAHREEIMARSADLQKQTASAGDDDAEMKTLFEEVEKLARGAGLAPQSMRPQKVRDLGLYRLLSLELLAEGPSPGLARFLYDLRGSKQLLRVDRMQADALREAGKLRAELLVVKIVSPGSR